MSGFLEVTIDKFTFKIAADRIYTTDHLWVKIEAEGVRVGLSDYLQQTSGWTGPILSSGPGLWSKPLAATRNES